MYSVYSQIQSLSCHLLQKQRGIYQVKINNHKQIHQHNLILGYSIRYYVCKRPINHSSSDLGPEHQCDTEILRYHGAPNCPVICTVANHVQINYTSSCAMYVADGRVEGVELCSQINTSKASMLTLNLLTSDDAENYYSLSCLGEDNVCACALHKKTIIVDVFLS